MSRAARVRPIVFPAPAPVVSAPVRTRRRAGRRRRTPAATVAAVAATLATASIASLAGPRTCAAQVTEAPSAQIFPDPSKFAYGLYTQGELGAVTMFGSAGPHLKPGLAMGASLGYDLARFLAIEARALGSTHLTRFPSAPQDGELVQLYHLLGALKLSLRWRQLAFFAEGTGGIVHTSTNILQSAGVTTTRNTLAFGGGLGAEYHPLSRRFSFGVRATAFALPSLASSVALVGTAHLRYVF